MHILQRLRIPATATAIMAASLLTSCANVTFIGHERAYDLNIAVKADLTSPVATNLGFESKTGLAVPPQNAMLMRDLFSLNVHEGDVLPTVSRLSAKRVPNTTHGVDYVSIIATGNAAVLATAARGTTVNSASPNAVKSMPAGGTNDSEGADSFVEAVTELVAKP